MSDSSKHWPNSEKSDPTLQAAGIPDSLQGCFLYHVGGQDRFGFDKIEASEICHEETLPIIETQADFSLSYPSLEGQRHFYFSAKGHMENGRATSDSCSEGVISCVRSSL